MSDDNQESKPVSGSTNLGNLIDFNKYFASLVKQIAPMNEISENLSRSLSPMLNVRNEILQSMQPLVDLQLQNQAIANELAKTIKGMIEPLQNFRLNIENLISPVLTEFAKTLAALPERTRKTLMTLAKHGWYFDPEMPFGISEIESALDNGDIETANMLLIEYFSERLPDIEEKLKEKFPARTAILESAFNAHKRKEYALSIPVFLIQADGICYDLINKQLYSKSRKDGTPVIAEYAKTITADTFRSILLYPLTQPLPISASAKERSENFNDLNRHQIIHGEVTTYDTELNSLKAISLLNYVSYVLSQESDDSTEEEIG